METHDDYYDHPLFNSDRLLLVTPQLEKLKLQIEQWVWRNAPGGCVLGESRMGKSTAIQWVKTRLRDRSGRPLPVITFQASTKDIRTITAIWRRLCWRAKLRVTNRDSSELLAENYLYYLMDVVSTQKSKSLILIVDEMQRLAPKQISAFSEIYDELIEHQILVTTVLVGNARESDEFLKQIKEPQFDSNYNRFFLTRSPFEGLKSSSDVEMCLKQYDELRFPEPDGPTYTEFFVPMAFQQGWRLADFSQLFWEVFTEETPRDIGSWGMRHFVCTTNALLTDFLPDKGLVYFGKEMIRSAYLVSPLEQAQAHLEQEKQKKEKKQ